MCLLMVVDDDEIIREMVKTILTSAGHDILLACNGQEALSIFSNKHDKIHLVIMDITMPVMNGIAASIAMRAVDPAAKIILISGYSDRVPDEAKPNAFLAKPFGDKALCELVRRVLQVV